MTARWKAVERAIAERLGGRRVPVSGRQEAGVDIAHDWLAIEVKHTKRIPVFVVRALGQAKAGAKEGQLPIAVLHPPGSRIEDSVVCLRLADFEEWFVR